MKRLLLFNWILLPCLFCICSFDLQSQIQRGGTPYSFENTGLQEKIELIEMPSFDLEAMKAEDEIYFTGKGQPLRFGKEFEVQHDLENSGQWETLPNGDRVWRLQVYSEGALSLNFIYDQFYIPEGGKLFLYNPDHSTVLGSFTHLNNKPYNKFSTTVVRGNTCIFEYYEPAAVAGEGNMRLSTIVHGYKDFYNKEEKGYGDSGSCNNNVNCSVGEEWQNQKRAVAMIIEGGSRACSGAMINNANNDGTPYFLSAYHCAAFFGSIDIPTVEDWVFMFNYESPNCSNEDGPTNQTVSGCFFRAGADPSDFLLVELSEQPPASYNVFLAGWNREDVAASSVTGIHHPAGDIKKITFDEDGVFSAAGNGTPNTHWEVSEWEDGTTEGGSSGSPLFNSAGQIIGDLTGGFASCSAQDEYDTYGKVAYSWESNGSTPDVRLKDWLDPNGTGLVEMDGLNLAEPAFAIDGGIGQLTVAESDQTCETEFNPTFRLSSFGADNLTSVEIEWQIDNGSVETYSWSGSLGIFDSEDIELGTISLGSGEHTLTVEIVEVNGNASDENDGNNTLTETFEVIAGETLMLNLSTDQYANETSFTISSEDGEVVAQNASLQNLTDYELEYCLSPGCYTFEIADSYGDGICCNFGDGEFSLVDNNGEELGTGGDFGDGETIEFCLEGAAVEVGAEVAITVLLEGPYDDNGQMDVALEGIMPEEQPFNVEPYNYEGNETMNIPNSLADNVVDWILVEARTGTPSETSDPGTMVFETKAGLLLDDGLIVDANGNALRFETLEPGNSYYFGIRHRNHLDVLAANSVEVSSTMEYDFTTGMDQAWGPEQQKMSEDGEAYLYAGDINKDGIIQVTDYDIWAIDPAVLNTYGGADTNLDGLIQVTDYDNWALNKAKVGSAEMAY